MTCKYCNEKGYILGTQARNAELISDVRPCPKCKDMTAYSKYIKEELFGLKHTLEKVVVIDFAKARKQ